MEREQLELILSEHAKWLSSRYSGNVQGKRADLSGANLIDANLRGVDLSDADLSSACLSGADLRGSDLSGVSLIGADLSGANLRNTNLCGAYLINANLSGADLSCIDLRGTNFYNTKFGNAKLSEVDLSGVDLSYTNLSGVILLNAYLSGADLRGANLSYANLSGANLSGADLSGVDLNYANLSYASLNGANLTNIKFNEDTSFLTLQCPKKGSFIGWKKASDLIVELEIPTTAKRSSATTRQCRCSEAKVLSITNLDGSCCEINSVVSSYDKNFIYTVGETVKVADFDEDRWNECAPGIHFFITREEAVTY